MDINKIEQMWKMMMENNFNINDDINSEYLCIICNKILIEACNAPCGCRYCKQCIREYLSNERKVCPGTSEYCKNKVIDIDKDILADQPMNIKVSKLKVKCPIISCQSKVELKAMEDHLRICFENRFIQCPYFNVGCAIDKLVSDKAGEHLLSEIHPHTKLLMEWITNSQNDSESLKKEMQQLMKDNKEIKEKIGLNEERFQNQREDMERQKSENYEMKEKMEQSETIIRHLQTIEKKNAAEIDKLGEEMSALKNDNRSLKEELRISISEWITKMNKQKIEIDQLNNEMDSTKYDYQLLKGEMLEMRNKEIFQLQFNTRMEAQIKEIDQLKQKFKFVLLGSIFLIFLFFISMGGMSRANDAIESGSELRTKMNKQNKEIDQLNDELDSMKNENKLWIGEMQEMRNKEISQLQFNTQIEEQIKEIDQLKQKCKDIEMKLAEISRANDAIKSGSEKSMEIMREIVDQSKFEDLVWKIENWKEKRKQAQNGIETEIYSGDFFTHKNGYKMRLKLYPDGNGDGKGTHLSLFFRIMRGPIDDILQWPFKLDVELSLIDQQSGVAHLTRTLKYSDKPDLSQYFMKPMSEENLGFGYHQFMKLSELSTKPGLTLGNQIFIRCKLSKST